VSTFVVIYAASAVFALVCVVLMAAIERRKRHEPPPADSSRYTFEAGDLVYADLSVGSDQQTRYLFLPIRYVNRESSRRVVLTLELWWSSDDHTQGTVMGPLDPILESDMASPLPVEPQSMIDGTLAFHVPAFGFEYRAPSEVRLRNGSSLCLRITDEIPGETVEEPVPSTSSWAADVDAESLRKLLAARDAHAADKAGTAPDASPPRAAGDDSGTEDDR
jgi:hypothetical protein